MNLETYAGLFKSVILENTHFLLNDKKAEEIYGLTKDRKRDFIIEYPIALIFLLGDMVPDYSDLDADIMFSVVDKVFTSIVNELFHPESTEEINWVESYSHKEMEYFYSFYKREAESTRKMAGFLLKNAIDPKKSDAIGNTIKFTLQFNFAQSFILPVLQTFRKILDATTLEVRGDNCQFVLRIP